MISLRQKIESRYRDRVQQFEQSPEFRQLESGKAPPEFYRTFITNVCTTHLKSPQILAFIYAAAPPAVALTVQHNLLEELGLDEAWVSHPTLLRQLATAAGFTSQELLQLENAAQAELKRLCAAPLLYGTLKEFGLAVLLEVTSFEWMLSRLAERMGRALQSHAGLGTEELAWFFHHGEVDCRHAEEGLDTVVEYIRYYEVALEEVEMILDITFREDIFHKRYFAASGAIAAPVEVALLS